MIGDPNFKDPEHGDFTFTSLKTAKKIDFKPFDYTTFGVYGDETWKEKAELPEVLIKKFDVLFYE
jgi:hypothetical protein